jgi:GAF domain-containing protein
LRPEIVKQMNRFFEEGLDPAAIGVRISEMLVATAEASDELVDRAVGQVLKMLRVHLNMDVVFVSEFVDGRREFKRVEADPTSAVKVGMSDALENTYCQRVVDGRLPKIVRNVNALPANTDIPDLPFPVGCYISTPIALKDGSIYGTLCAFSAKPHPELTAADLKNLQLAAELAGRNIR